jgi:hypothetical protein
LKHSVFRFDFFLCSYANVLREGSIKRDGSDPVASKASLQAVLPASSNDFVYLAFNDQLQRVVKQLSVTIEGSLRTASLSTAPSHVDVQACSTAINT